MRNDDSIVLRVRYGDVELLLTGDAGPEFERGAPTEADLAPLRILKVGHHGSRTSTSAAFLATYSPQLALVSAGRGNLFGHPAPEVIGRLQRAGIEIFRTDRRWRDHRRDRRRSVAVRSARGRTWTAGGGGRLDACPGVLELIGRGVVNGSPLGVEPGFERVEAGGELVVGIAERRLRLESELARQIGEREQQVAKLFGGPCRDSRARPRGTRALFFDLGQTSRRSANRSPPRRRACLFHAPATTPAATRHAGENTLLSPARACSRAFSCSHCSSTASAVRAVAAAARPRQRRARRREDVRMPPDEFLGDGVDRVGDLESPGLEGDLRLKDALKQDVAELALEPAEIAAIDRVDGLVGLFEQERPQRRRASARGPTDTRAAIAACPSSARAARMPAPPADRARDAIS